MKVEAGHAPPPASEARERAGIELLTRLLVSKRSAGARAVGAVARQIEHDAHAGRFSLSIASQVDYDAKPGSAGFQPAPMRILMRSFTPRKIIAILTSVLLLWSSGLCQIAFCQSLAAQTAPPPPDRPKSPVKKGPKSVRLFKPELSFSTNPSDLEIQTARVFLEPLVPMNSAKVSGENQALAKSLIAFKAQKDPENVSDLTTFIAHYPKSRWIPSLKLNVGMRRFETGYLTDALSLWQSAWDASKQEPNLPQKGVADEAIAQLCKLKCHLGKKDELAKHLAEIKDRSLHGSVEQKISDAKESLWLMQRRPDIAYKCGPFAINSILTKGTGKALLAKRRSVLVDKTPSTDKGTNLAQLEKLANQAGLKYRLAKRSKGTPLVVPSVMHWKQGHFAAIVARHGNRYQVQDPTFGRGGNLWISANALEAETDGFFLIPQGPLPKGWQALSEQQAQNVWGKGLGGGRNPGKTPDDPTECTGTGCPCEGGAGGGGGGGGSEGGGMPIPYAFSMNATLKLMDTPLSYQPPIGPTMNFLINYNHLEGNQPSNFTFANLGQCWSLNWISYITFDASQNASVSVRGGGYEQYNYLAPDNVTSPYPSYLTSQSQLIIVSPGVYNRLLPDGSVQVFNQADGTGRIFMTQVIDPQGNSAFIQYDANFRITAITDALGQVSTLTYVSNTVGNAGYYKIQRITDPFSRFAQFAYDSSTVTQLLSITDVIGLVSQFVYDSSSSFIGYMTTPYGTTSFFQYVPGEYVYPPVGLKFVFPDNSSAVIENWIGDTIETYYWDREQTMHYPSDPANLIYTHCKTTQWMLSGSAQPFTEEPVMEWVKPPLENRTNFAYDGQQPFATIFLVGPSNKPNQVSRDTNSGTQTWSYARNTFAKVTQETDPVGRMFAYTYASNGVDLLEKRQIRAGNKDLMGKWIFNNTKHVPDEYIDGSGQHTDYTYNSFGELLTLTDALSNVWTMTYDSDGYLTQINGPLSGNNDVTTFGYDGFGRLYSVTNSTGYTRTFNYDDANRLTQITYPDGTFEKITYSRLDAVLQKDRNGRTTQRAFDSMGQMGFEIDPLGRKTQYTWCRCGALLAITDGNNNTTSFVRDIEGRVTKKVYADSTDCDYTFDEVGRLQTRTDALNQVTTYGYFLDNRLNTVVYTNEQNPTSDVTLTYDANYPRISTVQNGWGTNTWGYYPYITDPFGSPTTGAGMVQNITNNVIANSAISYTYDQIGRTTNRSINGGTNSTTWAFDAMSRVTSEIDSLGTFGYNYVDNVSGSSKGVTRLASINYPNSQVTKFNWYGTALDERLQGIQNIDPTGKPLSQFNYAYNPAGEIVDWAQQNAGVSPANFNLKYDLAGQLVGAQSGFGPSLPSNAQQYFYGYDPGANRTSVQTTTTQTARIGGTKTTGDVLTITVFDSALTGGSQAVNYTVLAGDTLTTIATGLAAAISANANLQAIGVNAASNGTLITLKSASPNVTTYTQSVSGTETIALGINKNAVQNAVIGGTKTTGDILTIKFFDSALAGGSLTKNYTVQAGDNLTSIATNIAAAINADGSLSAAGITATSAGTNIAITSTSANLTTYTSSVSMGATETIALSMNMNGPQLIFIGGTKTTSDVLTLTAFDAALAGGQQAVSYTVLGGDTLTSIATGLTSAINGNANLQAIGISATSSGQVITVNSKSVNPTSFTSSKAAAVTETITIGLPPNGVQTAVIGGTKTTSDVLTITVFDAGLAGGSVAKNYTVLGGDTLTSIATGIAAAINGDANLTAIGVTATSSSTVVNIKSTSVNNTTYTKSLSGGATETITLGVSTGVSTFAYTNVNALTGITAGGATRYEGTTSKPAKSVSINAGAATLNNSKSFTGNPSLGTGANDTTVAATDGANNTTTNHYHVALQSAGSKTLTYDSNGNMTSDGTNTYAWDAENRLVKITYPGSNNFTDFVFDGLGRQVKVVETVNNVVTSTKQFVNCGDQKCESRDGTGAMLSKYFSRGQTISGSNYFYCLNHLGSITEMTDNSGAVVAAYQYDPWGRVSKISGSLDADFGYAGYYVHARSGLNLTRTRAYFPALARWINRDPIGDPVLEIEMPGGSRKPYERLEVSVYGVEIPELLSDLNPYKFVNNSPICNVDPLGLQSNCNCHNSSKPPKGPNSPCRGYGWSSFAGASEQCVCVCMGDSEWANRVRGCLACEKNQGVDAAKRHADCVLTDFDAWGWATLVGCAASCSSAGPAF